jgi:hypothetical protein
VAPKTSDEGKTVTLLTFIHPDGRAATMMREETSGAEQGLIYDPSTKRTLRRLLPFSGRDAEGLIRTAGDCNRVWNVLHWWGIEQFWSTCDTRTGQGMLCVTVIMWWSPSGSWTEENPRNCEEVGCACSGGGGKDPYHPSPF